MSDDETIDPLDTPDERPELPPAAQKEIQDDLDDYEIKFRDALDKHFGITRPPGENERIVKGGGDSPKEEDKE